MKMADSLNSSSSPSSSSSSDRSQSVLNTSYIYTHCTNVMVISTLPGLAQLHLFKKQPIHTFRSVIVLLSIVNSQQFSTVLQKNRIRDDFRRPEIPNFPGGACPQSTLCTL